MANRYWDAPIIYTRVGISADAILEVGERFNAGLTRDQFMDLTQVKITSARDKLRDMTLYGFIQQNSDGIYTLTEHGRAILLGGPQRSAAIENAVNQSPLWKKLFFIIGKSPDRALFEKAIKSIPELADINPESLANLWYAFTADIACITKKNPPFATSRKPILTKFTISTPMAPDTSVGKIITPIAERSNPAEDLTQQTTCEPSAPSTHKNVNPFELVIQFEGDKVYHITNEHWRSLARSLLTELEKKVL